MTEADAFMAARDLLLRRRSDYEAAHRDFRWPQLERFNWAIDYFDRVAEQGDRPALWLADETGVDERLSYRQLSNRSNSIANWLRVRGMQRGDRVLLMLANQRALWESMLACMKIGAVVVPASTLLTRDELEQRIVRGQVRHVISSVDYVDLFEWIRSRITPIVVGGESDGWLRFETGYEASTSFQPAGVTFANDPLLLYFTSGTTSQPKLVLHSHQSYPVGHLSTMYWLGINEQDLHLNVSSPGWAKHSWSSVFAPWNAGACVLSFNAPRFKAESLLDLIVRCGVTSICAPPTVWRMLIQHDLTRYPVLIRSAVSAGEPLNPEVIDQVRTAWGVDLRDGFGQTETTCTVANTPDQPVKAGSMGRALPGYEVVLVDEAGKVVDEEMDGEVALLLAPRPAGVMLEYSEDPAATARAFRGGIYRTGDVARRDRDGFITFIGRADDVFKSSDYRISPFELESVLIKHPAVVEAAVVPSPDPLRLAVPKAFVVLGAGFSAGPELAASILEFCKMRLSPYKRIRRIEFAVLPKTVSGKIRRNELREREAGRESLGVRGHHEFFEEDFRPPSV
jgi:acetyl-CoA synthetase